MIYTTGTTASLLNCSRETVRTYAEEFSRHLSTMSNPGSSKHRQFTEDDLKVLAVVAKFKRYGKTYHEIHEALDSGETADIDTSALTMVSNSRELAIMEAQIADLENKLEITALERDQALTASAVDRARREDMEKRVESLEAEVRKLIKEIGRLERDID
jgi:DNA-binding transcriptional MerR regulator